MLGRFVIVWALVTGVVLAILHHQGLIPPEEQVKMLVGAAAFTLLPAAGLAGGLR